ncbi:MAG: hypothetical protein KBD37_05080 [Burkholderiales bacterium]|nr:hypothetical protein [Burkholderiales bacterium]
MFDKIINYCGKSYSLLKHLFINYSKPIFILIAIDMSDSIEESLVYFENTRTKRTLTKNLAELYNNKILLRCFNNMDAAQIGYYYGKFIANA